MTIFLRLAADRDKATILREICAGFRSAAKDQRRFEVDPKEFLTVPGAPFAYWISNEVRQTFERYPKFESGTRIVRQGGVTGNDDRYVRLWWETKKAHTLHDNWSWVPFAKGGSASRWYGDLPVNVLWDFTKGTFGGFTGLLHRPSEKPSSADHYFKGGLTWPLRAGNFSPIPLPTGAVFSIRGYAILSESNDLLTTAAICNSTAFDYIFKICLGRFGFPEFIVGVLQKLPLPIVDDALGEQLSSLARRAWALKRILSVSEETSHAFCLPALLRGRLVELSACAIEEELVEIENKIDTITFDLYGFNDADRAAALSASGSANERFGEEVEDRAEADEEVIPDPVDKTDGLLSWSLGVACGRFDWRLATGEREAPPEPDPFDPLPAKSPGMLPDGAAPFHDHTGILVDDLGHPHDLGRLIEEVLARVNAEVPGDVRRWLQRDFFPLHLRQYSKSRRKAPIYWPLSTASGSYTLWLYYPSLTSQTLYTAINDFLEPKLKQVGREAAALREKGSARTREEEKAFEEAEALERELIELRDALVKIAPTYRPNHDDGVQITAAPLWQLFRHRPWQNVLKDTWAKLERGDYDWAHLAMAYWPDRVREKCETDKSLAIAHDLEDVYVEPAEREEPRQRRRTRGM